MHIKVNDEKASRVLLLKAEQRFDWVHCTSGDCTTLSVVPDSGETCIYPEMFLRMTVKQYQDPSQIPPTTRSSSSK